MYSLNALFGSEAAARVLIYLEQNDTGYAREMARVLELSSSQVVKQLEKFEDAGLLVSRSLGRTRQFEWNPRSGIVPPLRRFLDELIEKFPAGDIVPWLAQRRRPRKAGKPCP